MRAGPPKAAASHGANDRANESASQCANQSANQSVDHSADPTQAWSRYRDNVARHLIGIARDFQGRVMSHLSDDRGYGGLRPSLGPLLSLVWLEGRGLNAIASQLAISPQACSQLVNLAEGAGYLERKPDPQDGRSKVVGFTPQGRSLVEHAVGIIREIESEYTELVGRAPYRRFTAALSALNKDLGLPTHADPHAHHDHGPIRWRTADDHRADSAGPDGGDGRSRPQRAQDVLRPDLAAGRTRRRPGP